MGRIRYEEVVGERWRGRLVSEKVDAVRGELWQRGGGCLRERLGREQEKKAGVDGGGGR